MKVVLLAAGRGRRFGRRTERLPKCLIPLGPKGENLLSRYLESFRKLGLRNIIIVVGHEREKIVRECIEKGRGLSIKFLINPDFKKGSIVSLRVAAGELTEDCLVMDADVYFETQALRKLIKTPRTSFLLDPRARSTGEEMMVMKKNSRLVKVSKKLVPKLAILGEAVGFFKVKARDTKLLAKILERMVRNGKTSLEYEEAYNELMKKRKIGFVTISGFWTEMDFEEDLAVIRNRKRAKR